MKALIFDNDGGGTGVDLALRAQDAGHDVRYWSPPKSGPYGEGMLEKPKEWEPSMDWAELIVLTGNSTYVSPLTEFFGRGYPIFGACSKAAELELDRAKGQQALKDAGIEVAPFTAVDDIDDAIELVEKTAKGYAIKPWGGEADKALTCVARDADEAIFILERWKSKGLKGKLMLQELIKGVEIGIAGWFGPGGWSSWKEESFEFKKFMNDDLGCNTGEQGTVIRHVKESKLFDEVLEPMTEYLHACNYIGDCSVNCIVTEDGQPLPLEFTMRLGWPDFCIRQALLVGDPLEWMLDLVEGRDTFDVEEKIAVGVVLAHGKYPESGGADSVGYPIKGITDSTYKNLHLQQVMEGKAPRLKDKAIKRVRMPLSAGDYLMVATGVGDSVEEAAEAAYKIAWQIKMPSNLMFRTDIGKALKEELPLLQQHGFAKGLTYGR